MGAAKTNERDEHDEWADEVVRKIVDAERMGGGFRLHFETAAREVAVIRRERDQLLVVCARMGKEADWCPICEHHPSRGHHKSCLAAKELTS